MPHRWRLLLAGLFALAALATGAAFTLFPVPERLELPLGLVLLLSLIFAGWSLYRWLTARQPSPRLAPGARARRPTSFWRQIPWFCLQVAAIGFCAWVWASDPSPDRPPFGLALFLGAALAIALTAAPFILKDMIAGQRRLRSDRQRGKADTAATAVSAPDRAAGGDKGASTITG